MNKQFSFYSTEFILLWPDNYVVVLGDGGDGDEGMTIVMMVARCDGAEDISEEGEMLAMVAGAAAGGSSWSNHVSKAYLALKPSLLGLDLL